MLTLISRAEDLAVAALPKDVDLHTGGEVRAAGERLCDDGCRYLVLDTSPVAYMDSIGITVLLDLRQRFDSAGGALLVAVPDEHLRWRLDILGLDSVLFLTSTPAEAVARARQLRDSAYRPGRDTRQFRADSA
ncbi:STAS domain-containing protein [Streptomyces sp. NPDC093260]|uniref:STAS domain-containing protein n=1 Tax=Streptomyces sp. NPDC093260 TaxID=3155073 RepID=UPI00342346B6